MFGRAIETRPRGHTKRRISEWRNSRGGARFFWTAILAWRWSLIIRSAQEPFYTFAEKLQHKHMMKRMNGAILSMNKSIHPVFCAINTNFASQPNQEVVGVVFG